MPWVLGHDMTSDYFSKFAVHNVKKCRSTNPEDLDVSTMHGQWMIFRMCYEYMGFGRPGKQHGINSHGEGPVQVFYVHEVRDKTPLALRYGADGCPTEAQLQTLRRFHAGRREMWFPKSNTLPEDRPMRARLPRPVVYVDEVPRRGGTSRSKRKAQASGLEQGIQLMRIEEGTEQPRPGPSDN